MMVRVSAVYDRAYPISADCNGPAVILEFTGPGEYPRAVVVSPVVLQQLALLAEMAIKPQVPRSVYFE